MTAKVLIAGVAALLLVPASANAVTYCVDLPTCPGGVPKASFADALVTAATDVGIDDIKLGNGKYTGHFANEVNHPVRIQGTALTAIVPDSPKEPGLSLTGAGSTVSSVSVEFGPGAANQTGIRLSNGAAGDMLGVTGGKLAHQDVGFELGDGATLTHATTSLIGLTAMESVRVTGSGATISDGVFQSDRGVTVFGTATIERNRVFATERALLVSGGTAKVTNTLLDLEHGLDGLIVANGGHADLAHVTVIGAGSDAETGIRMEGATATIRDSIVARVGTALDAPTGLTLDHVAREPEAKVTGKITDVAPLTDDPKFIQQGTHQFTLAASSELIDTGSATPAAPGETDLRGNPRVADGNGDCTPRTDPGAYETVAPATCTVPPPADPADTLEDGSPTGSPVPRVDHTAPKLTKLKLTRAKVTFTLSEAAKVTLKIQRKSGRRYGTARTLSKASRAGSNSVALRLHPGHYRIFVEAVDVAGNRVSVRRSL